MERRTENSFVARKEALTRLTSGSGWSQKSAAQKSAEKGAFTRSYASNIATVKANAKSAKASLSAQHKTAKSIMAARHKSALASAVAASKPVKGGGITGGLGGGGGLGPWQGGTAFGSGGLDPWKGGTAFGSGGLGPWKSNTGGK